MGEKDKEVELFYVLGKVFSGIAFIIGIFFFIPACFTEDGDWLTWGIIFFGNLLAGGFFSFFNDMRRS